MTGTHHVSERQRLDSLARSTRRYRGREMRDIGRSTMAALVSIGAIKSVLIRRRRLIPVGEIKRVARHVWTRRYAICVLGPGRIEVIDRRYLLDGLLAWPELRPPDEDCFLSDFEDLLCELSAGPTLNEADESMFAWLEASAGAWDDAGLDADPPDDAVAARHGRLCQNSVVFKGSMAEAERFLRGMVEYSRRH